jgi:predicted glycogen debranching enzyme
MRQAYYGSCALRSRTVTTPLTVGREICGELVQALRREWLVTNGLGGFAAGTVAGCQTRRYHGLLIAATQPPAGRTLYLVDLDPTVYVCGQEYQLACHEYGGGVIHPTGHQLIERFELDGSVPTWTYALGPARLLRQIYMARARNTSYVRYVLERADEPVQLRLRVLATARDYHWQGRGVEGFAAEPFSGGCRVRTQHGDRVLQVSADAGEFRLNPEPHWNLYHREEAARGLDSLEDLYSPGCFEIRLEPGGSVHVTASIEQGEAPAPAVEALSQLRRHEAALLQSATQQPGWIRQLLLSADQFIAARGASGGRTVIAGYPWFADWGRDTMISLPGLTLSTGRSEVAAQILRTFARFVDGGMLPNRFPDSAEHPEYNTADATLWYFVALQEYLAATADFELARELWPTLTSIIEYHQRGTRHGIAADPADGLLRAGEPGVQLTWMDAKVGDWVVTPRIGKPVEINALWCNALAAAATLADRFGPPGAGSDLQEQARRALASFRDRFWFAEGQYLYDVIDGPDGKADTAVRPNQLLVLALPRALLDVATARRVLTVCERELLVSHGLRTLSRQDQGYIGVYQGDQWHRDGAYHQGTVWPWLLGAFARAHYRLYRDRERAAAYLAPIEQHLIDAGIGQISEIMDGDPPHRPRGCFAQAWSVAEVLRAWSELHDPRAPGLR